MVVAAGFEMDAYIAFKELANEQCKTNDALIYEAVELLFKKYERPVPEQISKKLRKLGIAE